MWLPLLFLIDLTDPSLDAKAAEIASMVGGGKDSNLDDDQESEGHGSISGGPTTFKRSVQKNSYSRLNIAATLNSERIF